MTSCPECGGDISGDDRFCPSCGYDLKAGKKVGDEVERAVDSFKKTDAGGALSTAFQVVSSKPMILVPAVGGAIIPFLIDVAFALTFLGGLFAPLFPGFGFPSAWFGVAALWGIARILALIASFVLLLASLHMAREAYRWNPLSVSESVGYVIGRFGIFVVAAIIGAILSATIILMPIAILMFTIMIVDNTGISDALSKSIGVAADRLGDVAVIFLAAIIVGFILGIIPVISSLLQASWQVLVGIAFMILYYGHKGSV
jgi:hypothetical protein